MPDQSTSPTMLDFPVLQDRCDTRSRRSRIRPCSLRSCRAACVEPVGFYHNVVWRVQPFAVEQVHGTVSGPVSSGDARADQATLSIAGCGHCPKFEGLRIMLTAPASSSPLEDAVVWNVAAQQAPSRPRPDLRPSATPWPPFPHRKLEPVRTGSGAWDRDSASQPPGSGMMLLRTFPVLVVVVAVWFAIILSP